MAGMFSMGINSATAGSHYDKARALANLKMEEAKSLPFATVSEDFPEAGNGTPYDASTPWPDGPGGFEGFHYTVEKEYMTRPPRESGLTFYL